MLDGKPHALTVAHLESPGLDASDDDVADPSEAEIFWDSDNEDMNMDEDEGWQHLDTGKGVTLDTGYVQ